MRILAKKSFGQHWLKNKHVVHLIMEAADIGQRDTVLEIGPGTGFLTEAIVKQAGKVIAAEADQTLYENLKEKFGSSLILVESDILKVTNREIVGRARKYKLVANLPYNVGTAIVKKFLTEKPKPERMVVMLQKEVAERILAAPPKMSVLGVMCQLYADCSRVVNVKPGAFSPPPKVDSTVIRLDPKPVSRYKLKNLEAEALMQLVKTGFSSKRKQLHRNLANARVVSSDRTKQILAKIGLDESVRAEQLTVKHWVALFKAISQLK